MPLSVQAGDKMAGQTGLSITEGAGSAGPPLQMFPYLVCPMDVTWSVSGEKTKAKENLSVLNIANQNVSVQSSIVQSGWP